MNCFLKQKNCIAISPTAFSYNCCHPSEMPFAFTLYQTMCSLITQDRSRVNMWRNCWEIELYWANNVMFYRQIVKVQPFWKISGIFYIFACRQVIWVHYSPLENFTRICEWFTCYVEPWCKVQQLVNPLYVYWRYSYTSSTLLCYLCNMNSFLSKKNCENKQTVKLLNPPCVS